MSSFSRSWSPASRPSFWDERDDARNADRFDAYDLDEEDDLIDDEPVPRPTKPSPVRNALALGFIGAAWWLRRGLGARYALSAVGVGLLCAAAAFLVGERLVEAVLHLAAMADTIRSDQARVCGPALARPDPPFVMGSPSFVRSPAPACVGPRKPEMWRTARTERTN
jgi:hypothetical protein